MDPDVGKIQTANAVLVSGGLIAMGFVMMVGFVCALMFYDRVFSLRAAKLYAHATGLSHV
jgi:hypothetical protein